MHELPVISSTVDVCLEHAKMSAATKIVTVNLKVGEISDLEPEWMQQYFNFVTRDTIAEGCTLQIELEPTVLQCDPCGHKYRANIREKNTITCSECQSPKYKIESGMKYHIDSMEVV